MLRTFWTEFLAATGRAETLEYRESFAFGYTLELASSLLELVLRGKKTATSSCYPAYESCGEALPAPGDLSIVTDWDGHPRCVIETVRVTVLPFREMTYALCRLEGEDESLASWQHNHETAFKAGEAEEGYAFTPDMKVVFEEFKLVYSGPGER